jgi:hypothetical protein
MSRVAIFDAFSGISGDMTLGALVQCGLEAEWLRQLPPKLGLDAVTVEFRAVLRSGISCCKVDFDIPAQPHGRHLTQLLAIVAGSAAPASVKERATVAFSLIATVEAELHGTTVDRVHLHEVGAVDAVLDIIGSVWGLQLLGVQSVHCGAISLGDGTVHTAHGELPVPAPATIRLLEGLAVRPGPVGSGELVTPTGAAILRAVCAAPRPGEYTPIRTGFGAGSRDIPGRPNALRLTLAEAAAGPAAERDEIVVLAADMDDATGEELAFAAERLREAGALDVQLLHSVMKKGRTGVRLEVLARPAAAEMLSQLILSATTTLGVRSSNASRVVLPRRTVVVNIDGSPVRVKVARLPGGGSRLKAEYDDLSAATWRDGANTRDLALRAEAAAREVLAAEGEVITTD